MSKHNLKNRLEHLENSPIPRKRTIQEMTDHELCRIIGINNPTDEQLRKIIQEA